MTTANLPRVPAAKPADSFEWSLCAYMGVERSRHNSVAYNMGSDCGTISVKSGGFTLMAGSLCEGLEDFDSIWNLYESQTHSDKVAFITREYVAYFMTLTEFKSFVYEFCRLERESEKNGGQFKIRCRKESQKMLKWLADRVAA